MHSLKKIIYFAFGILSTQSLATITPYIAGGIGISSLLTTTEYYGPDGERDSLHEMGNAGGALCMKLGVDKFFSNSIVIGAEVFGVITRVALKKTYMTHLDDANTRISTPASGGIVAKLGYQTPTHTPYIFLGVGVGQFKLKTHTIPHIHTAILFDLRTRRTELSLLMGAGVTFHLSNTSHIEARYFFTSYRKIQQKIVNAKMWDAVSNTYVPTSLNLGGYRYQSKVHGVFISYRYDF